MRVCDTCWHPHGIEEILWVQTYVEIEPGLDALIRGQGDRSVTTEWFLHRPAGIGMKDADVEAFYSQQLIPELERIPEEKWLSNQFASRQCPPIVRFWNHRGEVRCDWSKVFIAPLYTMLFSGDRSDGEYVHLAYPCRGTDINAYVGPAGAYLFRRDRNGEKPPACLVFHMRAFVQSLVTAQLWAIARHLRKELHDATVVFRRNPGILQSFADAAAKLAVIGDPLEIDTGAFDAAQRSAHQFFERVPTEKQKARLRAAHLGESKLHTVKQWLALEAVDVKTALAALVSQLDAILMVQNDGSIDVVKAINDAIRTGGEGDDLDVALRHAKALDHHSVVISVLAGGSDLRTVRTLLRSSDDLSMRHLRQAIVRIHARYKPSIDNEALLIPFQEPSSVLSGALAILNGNWGDAERNTSQELAGILRGLRGNQREGQVVPTDWAAARDAVVSVRFSAESED